MFSVNVLLFGDFPHLARRVLGSLVATLDKAVVAEVRLCLNAVCPATEAEAERAAHWLGVPCYLYRPDRVAYKYPLMRKLLYDPAHPRAGDTVMWFDDDSYVSGGSGFWRMAHDLFQKVRATQPVAGAPYVRNYQWTAAEKAAFHRQPWYTGQPLANRAPFATGGWWMACPAFLAKWDYPVRELHHNGGDTLLGEILHQQGLGVAGFRGGVAVNADDKGAESRAKRRGATTRRPFEPEPPYDYSVHDFTCAVTRRN